MVCQYNNFQNKSERIKTSISDFGSQDWIKTKLLNICYWTSRLRILFEFYNFLEGKTIKKWNQDIVIARKNASKINYCFWGFFSWFMVQYIYNNRNWKLSFGCYMIFSIKRILILTFTSFILMYKLIGSQSIVKFFLELFYLS